MSMRGSEAESGSGLLSLLKAASAAWWQLQRGVSGVRVTRASKHRQRGSRGRGVRTNGKLARHFAQMEALEPVVAKRRAFLKEFGKHKQNERAKAVATAKANARLKQAVA